MKLVTFIKNSLPYNGGESASFGDEVADKMIAEGIAVDAASLKPKEPAGPQPPDPVEEFLTSLDGKKTKADLVEFGKAEFGIDLSADDKRDDLVADLMQAFRAKRAEAAAKDAK
jgi:hypothetical protein